MAKAAPRLDDFGALFCLKRFEMPNAEYFVRIYIMKDEDLKLLSIDLACEYLGMGRWSIYKLINQNKLKTVTMH